MHSKTSRLAAALMLSGAMTASTAAYADGQLFEVTIKNLTYGQVFSPPLVVAHDDDYSLFNDIEEASPGIVDMAENGMTGLLADEAEDEGAETASNGTPIPPGMSDTITLYGPEGSVISVAGMLVNTNDAFFAIRGLSFPGRRGKGPRTASAPAYDAGSEANNELCSHIPGPACAMGSGNARAEMDAEGFIHIHRGIHEVGDLIESETDWRNPVARVTIRRLEN